MVKPSTWTRVENAGTNTEEQINFMRNDKSEGIIEPNWNRQVNILKVYVEKKWFHCNRGFLESCT